jgi:phosphoketolase
MWTAINWRWMRFGASPGWQSEVARFDANIQRHKRYISEHGDDMPEIVNWRWAPVKTEP